MMKDIHPISLADIRYLVVYNCVVSSLYVYRLFHANYLTRIRRLGLGMKTNILAYMSIDIDV